jgi:hypothetical protein
MSAVMQSLQLLALGLPVMFGVILLFMALTFAITKIFPAEAETEEENAEG